MFAGKICFAKRSPKQISTYLSNFRFKRLVGIACGGPEKTVVRNRWSRSFGPTPSPIPPKNTDFQARFRLSPNLSFYAHNFIIVELIFLHLHLLVCVRGSCLQLRKASVSPCSGSVILIRPSSPRSDNMKMLNHRAKTRTLKIIEINPLTCHSDRHGGS